MATRRMHLSAEERSNKWRPVFARALIPPAAEMDIMKDAMERLRVKQQSRQSGSETRSGGGDDDESGSSDSDDSDDSARERRRAANSNVRRGGDAPAAGGTLPGRLESLELLNIPVPDMTKYIPLGFPGMLGCGVPRAAVPRMCWCAVCC